MGEIDRPKGDAYEQLPTRPAEDEGPRRVSWWRLGLWLYVTVMLMVGGILEDLYVLTWVAIMLFLVGGGIAYLAIRWTFPPK
jgi:hypothetical protein